MRILVWIAVVLAAGWSGYWYVGASAVERGATQWFEDRRGEGWAADTTDISTGGFPNRFDTTLTNIRLADPQTGLGWQAPFLQIFALSYQPNAVISVWPETQTLLTPNGDVAIATDDMRASLRLAANTALELENAVFEAKALRLVSDSGWNAGADSAMLAMRRREGTEATYDLFVDAQNVLPGDVLKAIVDPNGRLPDIFQTANFDAQVTFDRPWDRFAVEDRRPQPTKVELRKMQAIWGQMEVLLAGDFTVDSAGRPDGTVTIKVTNWRDILALGVENGILPDNFASTLETLLGAA
ncbi:MAG: DUF2125 domain-containing protein, partial [Planktomarina sp.]